MKQEFSLTWKYYEKLLNDRVMSQLENKNSRNHWEGIDMWNDWSFTEKLN